MKKAAAILFVLLLVSVGAYAGSYYVAIEGNDTAAGTESLPWRTIQKAADTLKAGDIVFIREGTYNERVILKNSGTEEKYIVFSNFQDDEVIISGNGIRWWRWNGLFDISNQSFIAIKGLHIENARSYGGIWVEDSSHITITQCSTLNTFSSGISCWSSEYITIDSCEVELACNNGDQECISIDGSSYVLVMGNEVHRNGRGTNGGEGIDVKNGSHDVIVSGNHIHHLNDRTGLYIDAWDKHTYQILVINNRVHDCFETGISAASENGGLLEDVLFYNNLSYNNKWGGIEIGSWSDIDFVGPMPIKNIKIINNTVFNNSQGIAIGNKDASEIVIRNNILSNNRYSQIDLEGTAREQVSIDHNLFNGESVFFGDEPIVGSALFLDAVNGDFHLEKQSPAIDNGSIVDAPEIDFDGAERPFGNDIDIGAFEYR